MWGGVNDYDEIFIYHTDPNNPEESPEAPLILIPPQGAADISDLLLSPLVLGIIIGFIAAFSILTAIFIKNRKHLNEISKELNKLKVSNKKKKQ